MELSKWKKTLAIRHFLHDQYSNENRIDSPQIEKQEGFPQDYREKINYVNQVIHDVQKSISYLSMSKWSKSQAIRNYLEGRTIKQNVSPSKSSAPSFKFKGLFSLFRHQEDIETSSPFIDFKFDSDSESMKSEMP